MTLSDAKKNPALFLYLWADESRFLQRIDSKSAGVIRSKQANQKKLLYVIAGGNESRYQEYAKVVYDCFKAMYGISPEAALVKLANGETVAGKNWSAGVFGTEAKVTGATFSQDSKVTVDPKTGAIMKGGVDVSDHTLDVTTGDKLSNCTAVIDGKQYTSGLASDGTYGAYLYTNANGAQYSAGGGLVQAADGDTITAKSNMWLDVITNWTKIIDWILSLFGINTSSSATLITAANTAPNQTEDGFVYTTSTYNSSTTTSMGTMAILAGGAALLYLNSKKKKKSE